MRTRGQGTDQPRPSRGSGAGVALVLTAVLLAAPALAVHRLLGPSLLVWAAGWTAAFCVITAGLYAFDKRRARDGGWRVPESLLHLAELLGGWPGAFLAQRLLRHKNAKPGYQVVFWFVVAIHQFVAVDALRGWPMVRSLLPG